MAIDYQHKDYKEMVGKWELIDDVCDYDDVEKYLIELNPQDLSNENQVRNEHYRERAVFYPVAGHTARGLNSLLFSKPPVLNVPPQLEYLATNADGLGVSIYQQAQDVAYDLITKSRGALYVSYPETTEQSSLADMRALKVFATIQDIEAEQIINWRVERDGALMKLSLVVISEDVEEIQSDGYEIKCVPQLRELALVSKVFIVRLWRKNKKTGEWYVLSESIPTDGAGNTWDEIPLTFVGVESNSSDIDEPNMFAMAKANVAHYRNSADFEDSVWFSGQAQPWMSGLNSTSVNLMKEMKMYVGSRSMLGVPEGQQFAFASAPPNPLVRQAMLDKIDMMIGMGARFITPTGPAKTATEADNDAKVQHSLLSMISGNLSDAYTQAIAWCCRFMRVEVGDSSFETTQDFVSPAATAQEISAIAATFVQGALPMGDYFRWLQMHGIVDEDKTVEEFSSEINVATNMPNLDQTSTSQAQQARPTLTLPTK